MNVTHSTVEEIRMTRHCNAKGQQPFNSVGTCIFTFSKLHHYVHETSLAFFPPGKPFTTGNG